MATNNKKQGTKTMASSKQTQAVQKVEDAHPAFPALVDPEIASAAMEFIGESGLGVFDLPRMKVPTGGAIAWEVAGIKGPEYVKSRDVVILAARHGQKAWYREPIEGGGGGKPPDCSSNDGLTGFGKPTLDKKGSAGPHDCLACPWNQFETKRSADGTGKGKDCKDYAQLIVSTPEGSIPTLVTVPAGSLKSLKKYFVDLMNEGKKPQGVVTTLTLVKQPGPPPFSQIVFTYKADHAYDRETVKKLADALKAALFKVPARQTAAAL